MIRVSIMLLLVVFPLFALAQQEKEMKTLFSDGARISGFGSICGGFMTFNSKYVSAIGGDGALMLNNFFLGGYGSRSIEFQTVHQDDIYYIGNQLGISQGGIMTGLAFRRKKMIQAEAKMQVGWGHLSLRRISDKETIKRDRVNAFTPSIQAKLNVTSFIQLCVGVSYQFMFGVDFPEIQNKDFQGLCGSVSLRFGWF